MKSKKLLWLFALMLVLSLVLAACAGDGESDSEGESGESESGSEESGSEEDSSESDSEDSEGEEAFGGDGSNDVVLAVSSDIVSLDPHIENDVPSSNVRDNIYETLVEQDSDMNIVEGLATDWEQKDDTTWVFTLREGVTFHDGSDFTAEDVKANLDRVLDPAVASPRAFLYDMVTEVNVLGDHELEIKTEYPFAPLLAHLAHDAGGVMSKDVIDADYENAISEAGLDITLDEYYQARADGSEEYSRMEENDEGEEVEAGYVADLAEYTGIHSAQNPIGTGYFKLEERQSGEKTVLSRYEDYWGEPAKPSTVTFKVVPEPSARIAELETGESHIVDPLQPTDVSRVESNEDTRVNNQPSTSLSYIGFNVEKEPFDDPKVRQAINLAINNEEIIEGIYQGNGTPATGPLAPGVFGYDESVKGLGYEPDQAKKLLEEAGYGDGFETTLWTNDNEQRVETALYVQDALSDYGIDVQIEELEWGAYLERTSNGEHDMFVLGWSTVTGDADYGLYALFHSEMVGSPGNRSFIKNDELDKLLDEGRRETDEQKRAEIYKEAQEKLTELAPMLYIHHQNYLTGVREEVENFSVDTLGIYQLKDVTISE